MEPITTIGALAGAATAVFKAVDAAKPLFGAGKPSKEAVGATKARLAGIAVQLERGIMLSKLLDEWLIAESEYDRFDQSLDDEEIARLDSGLRGLVNESIRDRFANKFFRTRFDSLPGVEHHMGEFRSHVDGLDSQLQGLPPGNYDAWRAGWPYIRFRLSQARLSAVRIRDCVDGHLSDIINEIQTAAR